MITWMAKLILLNLNLNHVLIFSDLVLSALVHSDPFFFGLNSIHSFRFVFSVSAQWIWRIQLDFLVILFVMFHLLCLCFFLSSPLILHTGLNRDE